MQRLSLSMPLLLALVACGSSRPPSSSLGRSSSPATPVEDDAPAPRRPVEPEPPPPPEQWAAGASLAPVKGSKVKRFIVAFRQTEGQATSAQSEAIAGLKPGRYHLAIHDGAACGKNAAAAGAVWADAGTPLVLDVARGQAPAVAHDDSDLQLAGDGAIVGHALVLHADRKGAPGKALACGVVERVEVDADGDGEGTEE